VKLDVSSQSQDWTTDLMTKTELLGEVNLQWEYGFLPRILNRNDEMGNFFKTDFINLYAEVAKKGFKPDSAQFDAAMLELGKKTALYKVLKDNFKTEPKDLPNQLFQCLYPLLAPISATAGIEAGEKGEGEDVRAIIQSLQDKGLTTAEIAYKIIQDREDAYPETAKEVGAKLPEVKNWTAKNLEFIKTTMFKPDGDFDQIDLNKLLIPQMQNLIYRKVISDRKLNPDNIKAIFEDVQVFWINIFETEGVSELSADTKETYEAFYGVENAADIQGMDDAAKLKASIGSFFGIGKAGYKKSLSFGLGIRYVSTSMIGVLVDFLQDDALRDSFKTEYKGVYNFLNLYGTKGLQKLYDKLKAGDATQKKTSMYIKALFPKVQA